MKKSQLLKDLQNRLSNLLQDPLFVKARQVRAAQDKGSIVDAIAAYNLAVSAEILRLSESSVNGEVKDKILSDFRKQLTSYMERNCTGHQGYDTYVAIMCEYLAMVAEIPLHPPEVRQRETNPPQDIDWLKGNFTNPLRIDDLAKTANMSTSTFHHHFRALTAMSPLQYQKWLRLNEARRLMLTERLDATNAAFQVGYESPSQFSREYSRLFGAPPLRDITILRQLVPAERV